jgi:hypothetical protein
MNKISPIRNELMSLLDGKNAHPDLDRCLEHFPPEFIHQTVEGIPYTPWQLLEHIRLAQWDILEFMLNPNHISPDFPSGYWPDPERIPVWKDWEASLDRVRDDLEKVKSVVRDSDIDLLKEIPHAPGYTYLREVLLIADHNAYHLGGLVILRRLMGIWS